MTNPYGKTVKDGSTDTYESAWNTMGMELDRIAFIMNRLDDLFYYAKKRHNSVLEPYLSTLWALYMRFTGLMTQFTVHGEIEPKLNDAQNELNKWLLMPDDNPAKHKYQNKLAEQLFNIHKLLMQYKQQINMGIQVKWRMSDSKRMRKQAGLE